MKPVTLPSATGIGSPLRIEVREDIGVVWVESWSTESTNRAWSNPKLDDLLDALGAVRKPRAVTTAAELNALPVGSILLDGRRAPIRKEADGLWYWGEIPLTTELILPCNPYGLTVLHEGCAA